MTERELFELLVESNLEKLEIIGNFIAETMRKLGVKEEKDIFETQLAVDEACTNIIQHAYCGKKGGTIRIQCWIVEPQKELIVKIADSGRPFNPEMVASPDTGTNYNERKVGGLGIFLMKRYMQSVKYSFGEKGNELTMIKRLCQR